MPTLQLHPSSSEPSPPALYLWPRPFCKDIASDPGRRPTPPLAAHGRQSCVTSSAMPFVAWSVSVLDRSSGGDTVLCFSASPQRERCSGNTSERVRGNQMHFLILRGA